MEMAEIYSVFKCSCPMCHVVFLYMFDGSQTFSEQVIG